MPSGTVRGRLPLQTAAMVAAMTSSFGCPTSRWMSAAATRAAGRYLSGSGETPSTLPPRERADDTMCARSAERLVRGTVPVHDRIPRAACPQEIHDGRNPGSWTAPG